MAAAAEDEDENRRLLILLIGNAVSEAASADEIPHRYKQQVIDSLMAGTFQMEVQRMRAAQQYAEVAVATAATAATTEAGPTQTSQLQAEVRRPTAQLAEATAKKTGGTQLVNAARGGDTGTVKTLLSAPSAHLFIDYQDELEGTPLNNAASLGHAAVAKQLIAARCNVDLPEVNGCTPLYNAASAGHASVTEKLLAARCNVDLQARDGCTPLHIAAQKGHAAVTKLLIASRCSLDLQEQNGFSPLHVTAWGGHAAVTRQLIAARSTLDLRDKNGSTALHVAGQHGHAAVADVLIAAKCNLDLQSKEGATPLHKAAKHGHANVAKHLLAARCNVNLQTTDGLTVLSVAAYLGHPSIAHLVAPLTNVDFLDGKGFAAVHYATWVGHADVTEKLIAARCNVDLQTKGERCQLSPLHIAVEAARVPLIKLLISARCNVNAQGELNFTPLHVAAQYGYADVTKHLLAARSNVDLQAAGDQTALHLAALYGYEDVAKQLLAAHINVDLQTESGRTALQMAEDKGHDAIATMIRSTKHKGGARTIKGRVLEASPEDARELEELAHLSSWTSANWAIKEFFCAEGYGEAAAALLQDMENTANKNKAGDTCASASKMDTDATEAGARAARVRVEAETASTLSDVLCHDAATVMSAASASWLLANATARDAAGSVRTANTSPRLHRNAGDFITDLTKDFSQFPGRVFDFGQPEHAGAESTLLRSTKHKVAGRAIKGSVLQASPEETRKLQEDADRAMKELLEEEDKAAAAAAAVLQRRKNKSTKKKTGHQGASASKAAPWDTDATGAGARAASGRVEANACPLPPPPPPLEADVEQAVSRPSGISAASGAAGAESVFMAKFSPGGRDGQTDRGVEAGSCYSSAPDEGGDVFEIIHTTEAGARAASVRVEAKLGPPATVMSAASASWLLANATARDAAGSVRDPFPKTQAFLESIQGRTANTSPRLHRNAQDTDLTKDFSQSPGVTGRVFDFGQPEHAGAESTLLRSTKHKVAGRAIKGSVLQASPEETRKLQEDADRAMKELLEEEDKAAAAAAAVLQRRKNKSTKKKTGHQGASASKTAPPSEDFRKLREPVPWDTDATEAGARAASGRVEANACPLPPPPPPLEADVEQAVSRPSGISAASGAAGAESVFMAKFSPGGRDGQTDRGVEAGSCYSSAPDEGGDVFESIKTECKVCMHARKSHLFVPCGHMCVCSSCAAAVMKATKRCPICCTPASQVVKLFLS